MTNINIHFIIHHSGESGPKESICEVSIESLDDNHLLQAQYNVSGLSCASCVSKIEKHLKNKRGR